MPDDPDEQIGRLAASMSRGSIVAAAGCGKTEQIARAVACSDRRRLILTHTHAGVDAVSKRLRVRKVPTDKYRVDTIAGWCLRFAASFPHRSGIAVVTPGSTAEWNGVYEAAARLIQCGAVSGIIDASYGGVFVDEYQDCTQQQHGVIRLLAEQLPSCVFGDHLQAIFDFSGQRPVDWNAEVFPVFPKEAELTTPWRWKNEQNEELAEWLKDMRLALERDGTINFAARPACLKWVGLPADVRFQQATVMRTCLEAMGRADGSNLIVIGDAANVNARAALAKGLSRHGFSNIEPVACKDLYKAARAIETTTGFARFKAVLEFVSKCMTGTEKATFERALQSHLAGGGQGRAKFGDLLPMAAAIVRPGSDEAILAFLDAIRGMSETHLYRREMFFAMRSALQIKTTRRYESLPDAIWEIQNRIRHTGRKFGRRSIGSTLLVKGLEFDRAVVVHAANMTRKDWYVALTRATRSVQIVSPAEQFTPPG